MMLDMLGPTRRGDRGGTTRRAMLRVGALAPLGLGLPALLGGVAHAATAASAATRGGTFGRAKRCLMLYMWGGPSHIDMFDMKPDAPVEYRGEFSPVRTKTPGINLCEHLPHLATQIDKIGLIRSITHTDNNHSTAAHWMLTGHKHAVSAENFNARGTDFPHIGSVVSKLSPTDGTLPTFVALPEVIATTAGAVTPGQGGGMLGRRYDPFRINQHPDDPDFAVHDLTLPGGMQAGRMQERRHLLDQLDATRRDLHAVAEAGVFDSYQQRAFDLITSPHARDAFNLDAEPASERDRYGRHTFGQSVLMARRLLESGVKLVTVYWHRDKPGVDTTWDTHGDNFNQLRDRLIPQIDRTVATLLADLDTRGMLDDTLVVWNSEFGRTPKVNAKAGRDHWGRCNSLWMAGAGVPGGQVYGSTDRLASHPETDPVSPGDFAATIYHLLGLAPDTLLYDALGRPFPIATGNVLNRYLQT
ncbi:MAG: DUF1501 domain-containing protein [Phycisphaera sp.]|nr:DUF1501 domain-containing protein [Phycisphaera sp.]